MDENKIRQIIREEMSDKFAPILAAQAIHLHFNSTTQVELREQIVAATAATDLLYRELERVVLELLIEKFSTELNVRQTGPLDHGQDNL